MITKTANDLFTLAKTAEVQTPEEPEGVHYRAYVKPNAHWPQYRWLSDGKPMDISETMNPENIIADQRRLRELEMGALRKKYYSRPEDRNVMMAAGGVGGAIGLGTAYKLTKKNPLVGGLLGGLGGAIGSYLGHRKNVNKFDDFGTNPEIAELRRRSTQYASMSEAIEKANRDYDKS